jgi:squalene-hopene/tetraprenyl-beta-curcumene cyclase
MGVPCDCDSTAWVLLALSSASDFRFRPLPIERALQFLQQHQDRSSGGFSTYILAEEIQELIEAPSKEAIIGWLHPHCCVTSVAIQSLLVHGMPIEDRTIQNAAVYLLSQKSDIGIWNSYWWKGYSYSTYHALRALSLCKFLSERERAKTIAYLLTVQLKDGSWNDSSGTKGEVFATAFTILALLLSPGRETLTSAKRGIDWLIRHQLEDGSWPSFPILRIPPAKVTDPQLWKEWRINQMGTGVVIADKGRIFTSAAALWALMQFYSMTLANK